MAEPGRSVARQHHAHKGVRAPGPSLCSRAGGPPAGYFTRCVPCSISYEMGSRIPTSWGHRGNQNKTPYGAVLERQTAAWAIGPRPGTTRRPLGNGGGSERRTATNESRPCWYHGERCPQWTDLPGGAQTRWLPGEGSHVEDSEGRRFVIAQCGSGSDSDRFTAVNPHPGKGHPRAGPGIVVTTGTGLGPGGQAPAQPRLSHAAQEPELFLWPRDRSAGVRVTGSRGQKDGRTTE